MRIAVLCERMAGERRVAVTPEATRTLVADGHSVVIESGAGTAAGMPDEAYLTAGATVAPDLAATVGDAGVVVSVNGPTDGATLDHLGGDHVVIGLFDPFWLPDVAARVAATGATMLALDLVPRSSRAQAVDVLSSMATVEGFQSVLLAAGRLPKMLPMLMTAAGTVPPARVLVLGAGVAGLQAIATARRLGAVVEGFDIREEALEQIRSLGAKSIDPPPAPDGGVPDAALIHEVLTPHVAEADIVIDTSDLNVHELHDKVAELYGQADDRPMRLAVTSFGYKHGAPRDADLVMDCRFLPNPHWVDELRPLSGLDAPVREHVLGSDLAQGFLGRLDGLLDLLLPAFVGEGRSYLTLAFGCTGGRHRSVAIAEAVAGSLRAMGQNPAVTHRDVDR